MKDTKHRRVLQGSAAIGAIGTALAMTAGPAAADVQPFSVTPATGLSLTGQTVGFSSEGGTYTPNFTVDVLECPYNWQPLNPDYCAILGTTTGKQAADGDLLFSGTVQVKNSWSAPKLTMPTCKSLQSVEPFGCELVLYWPGGPLQPPIVLGTAPIAFK
jgi:hypothetical protein